MGGSSCWGERGSTGVSAAWVGLVAGVSAAWVGLVAGECCMGGSALLG